jgi:hypothetical protein
VDVIAHEGAVFGEPRRTPLEYKGQLAALGGLGAEPGKRSQAERLQDRVEMGSADRHPLCLPAVADHS